MEDRRASERFRSVDYSSRGTRYVKRYFKVRDKTTGTSIGYMVDISSGGMMILSKVLIRENTTYRMQIDLPEKIGGSDQLIVDARSVWRERDTDSEFYRVGFSFVSTLPHHDDTIRSIFPEEETGGFVPSDRTEHVSHSE